VEAPIKKLTLLVFIDAFGWEIYQEYGFLPHLLPYHRKLETTFGFSSAADPSILTGRYPDEHTHWSSFIYSKNSPFQALGMFAKLPSLIFDRWRFRHWLSKFVKKFYRYTGYFELYSVPFSVLPYFDYVEKRDYFVPGGIMKTDTIFDWCVANQIPYYCSNWRHPEPEIIKENLQQIALGKIQFAYVYLPALDAVMHKYGPSHAEVARKIASLEAQVEKIHHYASKVYDEVSLYVISDHGMAPVTGGYNLIPDIEASGLKFGTDYVAFYDSTMARFWFLQPGARQVIENILGKLSYGKIMTETELKEMHVWFDDQRYGDLIFLLNEGLLINPSFMGGQMIAGMHGYHTLDKHSYAMITGNRPLPETMNSITDIRSLLENELHERN
jgi:predicted AlkP superfamily pyrophosphatase or phosphodiesterase